MLRFLLFLFKKCFIILVFSVLFLKFFWIIVNLFNIIVDVVMFKFIGVFILCVMFVIILLSEVIFLFCIIWCWNWCSFFNVWISFWFVFLRVVVWWFIIFFKLVLSFLCCFFVCCCFCMYFCMWNSIIFMVLVKILSFLMVELLVWVE